MTKSYYLYRPQKDARRGLYKEMITYTPEGDKVTLGSWKWSKATNSWSLIGQKMTMSIEEARKHWRGCVDPMNAPNGWEQS